MTAYYNENDPQAAAWLRQLIVSGLIPAGWVDERSIEDVRPLELQGFTQHHFFAGIGGWAYALRLAGWPDDRPVWTGSPPCQPFSSAGRHKGYDDDRHLAPKWLDLVKECRPPILFGEQVASAATNRRHPWLDDLQDHLEAEDYATGAVVLPACGVGAPHIRQRLWIVAERVGDNGGEGLQERVRDGRVQRETVGPCEGEAAERGGDPGGLADSHSAGREPRGVGRAPMGHRAAAESDSSACSLGDNDYCLDCGLGWDYCVCVLPRLASAFGTGPTYLPWAASDWLYCRDEKWRPVESGTLPLADGVSARVGRLRGYGNAIVPAMAAEVITCWMETDR